MLEAPFLPIFLPSAFVFSLPKEISEKDFFFSGFWSSFQRLLAAQRLYLLEVTCNYICNNL